MPMMLSVFFLHFQLVNDIFSLQQMEIKFFCHFQSCISHLNYLNLHLDGKTDIIHRSLFKVVCETKQTILDFYSN